ncbi:hypothetical protein DKT68_07165 [Micromonospora acroterricola]|uniref:Uncharacterized protein n=1 Tax=Micromonospora acroterricola TaxID=2202421 RepID=A0A317DBG9_9ACTN|nr:hypothetical protein [Micromonospora acroterricola]PWR11046.1 hypothetical protein DKT68_07165 [Micromonospora acroterricola]
MNLRAGDLLHITQAASVQFSTPILFRLIRVLTDRITYDGWAWIEGYQLDARGEAVARRKLFVQPAGLRKLSPSPRPAAPSGRREPAPGRKGSGKPRAVRP